MSNHDGIEINIDNAELERKVAVLNHIRGAAPRAISHAMNRAIVGVRTDIGRVVPKTYVNVGRETAQKGVWINRATTSNLSASIRRKGPRLQARRFPHDPNTNPGVRGGQAVFLRPRKDGGGWHLKAERNLSKAFVIRDKNGKMKRGPGIYRRIKNHRNRLTHARGLSVPEMLADTQVRKVIQDGAVSRFNKNLDSNIANELRKAGGAK